MTRNPTEPPRHIHPPTLERVLTRSSYSSGVSSMYCHSMATWITPWYTVCARKKPQNGDKAVTLDPSSSSNNTTSPNPSTHTLSPAPTRIPVLRGLAHIAPRSYGSGVRELATTWARGILRTSAEIPGHLAEQFFSRRSHRMLEPHKDGSWITRWRRDIATVPSSESRRPPTKAGEGGDGVERAGGNRI